MLRATVGSGEIVIRERILRLEAKASKWERDELVRFCGKAIERARGLMAAAPEGR
jgi:hypothetical protein